MNTINRGNRFSKVLLLFGWLLALLAVPAASMAGCEQTANSHYTMLIDSSSSCTALSTNMQGSLSCVSGTCTIPNPTVGGAPIEVTVTPPNAVGSSDVFTWSATGPAELGNKLVDVVIAVGATAGGTCGWSYTPGESSDSGLGFLKSNGTYQKINDIYFCSDFIAPPPATANIVLSKTVMLSGGTCGVDDVEVLETSTGTSVEYCLSVKNTGAGDASGVSLVDADALVNQQLGHIAAGEELPVIISPVVTITAAGETINTATVDWTNIEDPLPSTGTASDTAKVIAHVAIEACPEEYQSLVDGTIAGAEDFFGFAALYDPLQPERVSLCAPSGSPGIQCIDQCIIKESKDPADPWSCKDDPMNANCVEPNYQCEPSGYWSVGTVASCDTSGIGKGTPYCWELASDPAVSSTGLPDCYYKPVQVMKKHMLMIEQIHQNPFCFFATTVNVDGTSSTVEHCF